jgi:membrane-associated phospholipid phosphatase
MLTQQLRRAATFPRIRRHFAAILRTRIAGEFALLGLLFVATLPYVALRSLANDWRAPVDGSLTERSLFGGLPTVALQDRLHGTASGLVDQVAVYAHMSWFFVPAAVTLLVAFKWRSEFKSYAWWYLGVMYLAVIVFIAMPMSPPWLSDPGVTRIAAEHWGEIRVDNNPMAAFPSLHVALPLTLALWAASRRHVRLGVLLGFYTVIIASSVVYLGEHYVIDVIGACCVAGIVATADTIARGFSAVPLKTPRTARVLGRLQPVERGQNLIEFALMFPAVLLFIGVIVVFGLMLHTRSNLQQAVREGARQAAVGASLAQVQDLAAGNANETIDPADIKWCFPNGTGGVGDPVKVYIYKDGDTGYPYELVPTGGTFNAVFGAGALTVRMGPTATTRLEHSVSAAVVSAAGACPS